MDNMTDFKAHLSVMESKIDRLYDAVVGNKSLGNDGLVKRLNDLENSVEGIEKQIAKAKAWITGALFVGSAVGFVLSKVADLILKKQI